MEILTICKDYISRLQFLKSFAPLHARCIEIPMGNPQATSRNLRKSVKERLFTKYPTNAFQNLTQHLPHIATLLSWRPLTSVKLV